MITQTYDDVAIVLNGKDTVPDTTKRFDIQNKGVSKFSVDGAGAVACGAIAGTTISGTAVSCTTIAPSSYCLPKTVKKTIGGGGIKAQGTITISGTPVAEETMVIGAVTYTFKAARAVAGEITINANNATQVSNICTALTADSTDVVGTDGTGDTVVVTAAAVGTAGNALPFTESATGVAVNGTGTLGATTAGVNAVTADFNFANADNTSEQVIDLGSIVPARARVIDIYTVTEAQFTGATSLVAELGNTSSGHEFINSATIYAANAVLPMAADHFLTVVPNVAASKVYVSATPGANWSLVSAGKVSVYVTYIDVAGI